MTRLLVWLVLPLAVKWVRRRERAVLQHGVPLTAAQIADARAVGVARPECVRIVVADEVPPRMHPLLAFLGPKLGLISRNTAGMALGYGIYLRANYDQDRALLVHELVHTAQYERRGGVRPFLAQYLHECFVDGYPFGALEIEATDVTCRICG